MKSTDSAAARAAAPRIEGFEVLEPIGSGAMSAVWKARDRASGQIIALKVLHPHLALSESGLDRFTREVRAYERLSHGNVISCLRGGRSGDSWYVALELLDGGDLRNLLRAAGSIPPPTAVFVADGVLAGLAHAHHCGVLHRDVKPDNVMLTRDGVPKLADFGIATAVDFTRLTAEGELVGTPAYMAPEQVRSGAASIASDLWSVGILLYEMVSGENPFATTSFEATIERLRSIAPAPLGFRAVGVASELEEIVDRLLRPLPEERPSTAEAVRDALRPLLARELEWATASRVRQLIEQPAATRGAWSRAEADARLAAARSLLRASPPQLGAAFVEADEAAALEPTNEDAMTLVHELAPRVGARGVVTSSARINHLQQQAEAEPSSVVALVHLIRAARAEGDLRLAARAYRWGRRRAGRDRFAFAQLANALGFEVAAYLEGRQPKELRRALHSSGASVSDGDSGSRTLLRSWPVWLAAMGLVLVVMLDDRASKAVLLPAPEIVSQPIRPPEPDTASVYLDKAGYLMDAGDARRAADIYLKFLDQWPDHERAPDALFGAARAIEESGLVVRAIERYDEFIARHPTSDRAAAARRRVARLLRANGSHRRALERLDELAGWGDPEDRAAIDLDRAQLLDELGLEFQAITLFRALAEAGGVMPSVRAEASLGLGRIMLARNDPAALRWLSGALDQAESGSPCAHTAMRLLEELRGLPERTR